MSTDASLHPSTGSMTVSIAGLAVTATQGGGTPSFVVAPASVSLPAAGGTATVGSCSKTAISCAKALYGKSLAVWSGLRIASLKTDRS